MTQKGLEAVSIMFEMKNEMDTTATKHKNEDFFKELHKKTEKKKCEYAKSLVSENEYYNQGIVDVSQVDMRRCRDKTTVLHSDDITASQHGI